MRLLMLKLLCFSVCQFCFSQEQKKIDSLKHEFAISKSDSSQVLTLLEIGDRYRGINIDSAIFFDQRALILARKIKFPKGEVQALRRMAFAYRTSGNTPKALEIDFKALKRANSENLTSEQANIMNQIGSIYSEENDYSKALFFLKESYRLSKSIHFTGMVGVNQNVIGRTYCKMNQLDSALFYCLSAQKNINQDIPEIFAINARDIGLIYAKKGNKKQALSYFKNSVKLLKKAENYETRSRANYQIALLYQQSKHLDSAIYFANNALNDAQKGNFYSSIIEASKLLSEFYKIKDIVKSLQYNNMAIAAKDSLYIKGKRNAIQNLIDFDEKERQYEIETAQTAYKNQIKQYTLLSGLGVFLLIAFILYRNYRQQQKANAVLEKTLSDLKATQTQLIQREKMASLGELTAGIAHEIQNPLNFVNNFSELSTELVDELTQEAQAGRIEDVMNLAHDLTQNLQKITHHGKRASNIVKGMLEHSRTSSGQKEPTDLNTLADEYLRLAYQGQRTKDQTVTCELITDFAPNLPLVNVVPQEVGRVLLNLYNNAFYALQQKQKIAPADYQPTIKVSTAQVDGNVVIQVRDNGTGIPESVKGKIFQPFFTTKPTGEGTGLGLSLSYDIVTKGHEGELTVENRENEGTEFSIRLPFKTN